MGMRGVPRRLDSPKNIAINAPDHRSMLRNKLFENSSSPQRGAGM